MEISDALKPADLVKITVFGPDGSNLYHAADTGYHSILLAIKDVFDKSGLDVNPQDCSFEVTNESKGVTHQYRLNAHGNLKLIV